MKNKKTFRFKFSALTKIVLAIAFVICLGSIAWNIFNITEFSILGTSKIITYSIIIFLICVLLMFVLGLIIYSNYVIKNGYIYCYFGLIRNKLKIEELTEFIYYKQSDKLVAYFGKNNYTVIVIANEEYEQFIKEVRSENKQIIYRIEQEEENKK